MLQEVRTVFMGTPMFAAPTLNALVEAGAQTIGVVTQPDKPAGRGHQLRASGIGLRGAELGIPVYKPKGLKKPENRAFLWALKPDLLIVVAYGKILPPEVLDLPKFGAVNVHFSLLPRWRGPAPVPAAILTGDTETGVTIMKLDAGMDTGPLLAQERVRIGPQDTTGSLLPRLADLGASLLLPTLARYLSGSLPPTPQDEAQATVCPMLQKEDGRIDWKKPAVAIARTVRAYDPWPGTYTLWNGTRLIIRRATPSDSAPLVPPPRPGTAFVLEEDIGIATGDGVLRVQELQLEGRASVPAAAFRRGFPQIVGALLGDLARERVETHEERDADREEEPHKPPALR